MRIVIVGPCAAGKTTLSDNLRARGYDVEECAQEHSKVQMMWQRIAHPDVLIYLDVTMPTVHKRLQVDWGQAYLDEMNLRLANARLHAHFTLNTDTLSREEVCEQVVLFLRSLAVNLQ